MSGCFFGESREQGEHAHGAGVAARFVALGHEHVGAGLDGEVGVGERLHLADHTAPGVRGPADPGARVGERERDGGWSGIESGLEVRLGELEERRE